VAVKLKDSSICFDTIAVRYENVCLFNIAIEHNDPSFCEQIRKPGASVGQCYFRVADTNKNFEICLQIKEDIWRNQCFSSWAGVEGDISICDKITIDSEREDCYINVGEYSWINSGYQDTSICDNVVNNLKREFCYIGFITSASDYNVCEDKIMNKTIKNRCFIRAFSTPGAASFCNLNKEYSKLQERCKQYLGKTV
jgi:hypothetical protein